jgi:hypothetical protein
MAIKFQDASAVPPEILKMSEEAASRLALRTNEVRSLEAKIKAINTASLRKRLRECRNALADVFEGQDLATRQLQTLYLRNAAGLQMAQNKEVARLQNEAQRTGAMGLTAAGMARAKLDMSLQLLVTGGRMVLEADARVLDAEGNEVPAPGNVLDGAVRIATKARDTLIKARDATAYEIRKATLPPSLTDANQSVAALLKQQEARSFVRAMGPLDAMTWALGQLDSAIKMEDQAHIERIEAAAGPYASEIARADRVKVARELESLKMGAHVRDQDVSDAITGAIKLRRAFDDLREARVSGDLKVTVALIESMIALWQAACGMGDIKSMSQTDFRRLLESGAALANQQALSWEVDCTFLLRDVLGPDGASALRQIPSMRAAISGVDARQLASLRAGRSGGVP